MEKLEKVMKGLEELCEYLFHEYKVCYKGDEEDTYNRFLVANNALELLKVQEPVKPVVDVDTWKCGNCGHTLEHQELLGDNVLFHEQYNYCPNCGKPVKWDG